MMDALKATMYANVRFNTQTPYLNDHNRGKKRVSLTSF